MDTSDLKEFIDNNTEWYSSRGKNYKRLSIACRGATWLLATLSILSMTAIGATSTTVLLGLCAASSIALDRIFALTRNWLEFSGAEIALKSAAAQIEFLSTHGGTKDEILEVFGKAANAVESETLGWRSDVLNGMDELRISVMQLNRKQ